MCNIIMVILNNVFLLSERKLNFPMKKKLLVGTTKCIIRKKNVQYYNMGQCVIQCIVCIKFFYNELNL